MAGLKELLLKRFEVSTRVVPNPLIATIGTTAALVLPNNPNRLAWVITNLSINLMYISFYIDVASTKGILLDKNGGSVSAVWSEDFEAVAWEIYIVAAGASSAVYSYEVVTI